MDFRRKAQTQRVPLCANTPKVNQRGFELCTKSSKMRRNGTRGNESRLVITSEQAVGVASLREESTVDSCLITELTKELWGGRPGRAMGTNAQVSAELWILLGEQRLSRDCSHLSYTCQSCFQPRCSQSTASLSFRRQIPGFHLCPCFLPLSISFSASRCEYFLPSCGWLSSSTPISPAPLSPPQPQTL